VRPRRVATFERTQAISHGGQELAVSTIPVFSYWYFHLPNFVLAALMYTLLGRALLSLFLDPDSSNYIWRFFCQVTEPFVGVVAAITPKDAAPIVVWLFGFVWLFWLRVLLLYIFLVVAAAPGGN
jgi:uncharacterized protein YggT (Ycf19 family)